MFSITMTEALNTLAAFSDTVEVLEWVENLLFQKREPCVDEGDRVKTDTKNTLDVSEHERHQTDTNNLESINETSTELSHSITDNCNDNNDSSNGEHRRTVASTEQECDISRDRLVEFVEDKIEQLELQLQKDADDLSGHQQLADEQHICKTSQSEDLLQSPVEDVPASSEEPDQTSCEQNENTGQKEEQIISDQSSKAEETEHDVTESARVDSVVNKDLQSTTDSTVFVNTMEYTLSSPVHNDENKFATENRTDDDEEHRPKKLQTAAWNPIPLIKHLYRLDQDILEKVPHMEKSIQGYVDITPNGTFAEKGGHYYVVIENCHFYCFESEKKKKELSQFMLHYGILEDRAKNTLVLDNRLGRVVQMKFSSESELSEWKETLQANCHSIVSSQHVEPVHYPLKSHKDVIIIDLGSCSTRAGILMDHATLPSIYFPTVCATDKTTGSQVYGIEALDPAIRQKSVLSYPVRPSVKVTKFTLDVDALNGLFKKVFHDLRVDPHNYIVQLCIPRSLSTNTQVAIVKLLLEDLCVKAVSLTRQALLTLYANNTSTAIVVDIGDRMDILPVVDGFILETGATKLPYGGQRIIHHIKHALAQKHISLSSDVESFVVQYIYENLCYIAGNYEEELQRSLSNPEEIKKSIPLYPFFKGKDILQIVTLDTGRFQVPEGLFNPDLWGLDFLGIHKLVHKAIQTSGMDVRRQMAESIYVSGGVTLIPGFVERLEMEVAKLTLPRLKPQVHASPFRCHMAYLGACKLAASNVFDQVCVNIEEWQKKKLLCLNKWHL